MKKKERLSTVESMSAYQEKRSLPYTAQQMYALVADVRRYPEFLPWCQEAIIHTETSQEMCADLVVGQGPFQGRFQSRVSFFPFQKIQVDYQEGPLKYLKNEWMFEPLHEEGMEKGCSVNFFIDFEFKNPLFEHMMHAFFEQITGRMMAAFEARANKLYTDPSS